MIHIEVTNHQAALPVDEAQLKSAAQTVLEQEGIRAASLSVAVVDNQSIHALNRRYLGHDSPTDVLSFLLEKADDYLEGEVIASVETAAACAPRYRWSASDELLLYTIHGVLHMVGYDDQQPRDQDRMRERENYYLAQFGAEPLTHGTGESFSARNHRRNST